MDKIFSLVPYQNGPDQPIAAGRKNRLEGVLVMCRRYYRSFRWFCAQIGFQLREVSNNHKLFPPLLNPVGYIFNIDMKKSIAENCSLPP